MSRYGSLINIYPSEDNDNLDCFHIAMIASNQIVFHYEKQTDFRRR